MDSIASMDSTSKNRVSAVNAEKSCKVVNRKKQLNASKAADRQSDSSSSLPARPNQNVVPQAGGVVTSNKKSKNRKKYLHCKKKCAIL